jgi:hypothetical protein
VNTFNRRPPSVPGESGQRRSRHVAVVLLAAAGVVGLPLYIAHRDATPVPDDQWRLDGADGGSISPDQEYSNDDYIPNVGYYHAPYNAWYPFRYNYYYESRGYYAGGNWHPQAEISQIVRSRPSSVAYAALLAAQRERQRGSSTRSSWSNWFSGGSSSNGGSRSRWSSPTTTGSNTSSTKSGFTSSPASHPSVIRGGFGQSSSHSSGSGT